MQKQFQLLARIFDYCKAQIWIVDILLNIKTSEGYLVRLLELLLNRIVNFQSPLHPQYWDCLSTFQKNTLTLGTEFSVYLWVIRNYYVEYNLQ